ncbi:MAG: aldolase/citrate lyase family protein [Actinomycetota bacterium]|nr:aldolase/citrate lyase family protein [Actinomycetota bacterium]
MNGLRSRLQAGPVVGTFVKLPRPEVVDVMALAGFDFVVCDYEHAQTDVAGVLDTVRAGSGAGIPVLVRLPELDRGLINRVLEAGAAGIQLARANAVTATELRRVIRYPPEGTRSISLTQPAARYGTRSLGDAIAEANAQALGVGQFETRDYAVSLDEAVAALDVAFIGPVDLSVDLGYPDEPAAGPVRAAMAAIEAAAARTRTPLGTFAATRAAAGAAVAEGYRYVVVSSDLGMLVSAARAALAASD